MHDSYVGSVVDWSSLCGFDCSSCKAKQSRYSRAGSGISAGVGEEVEVAEQPEVAERAEVADVACSPTVVVVHREAVSQALALPPAPSPHGARTP